jgi:hypothetical protein
MDAADSTVLTPQLAALRGRIGSICNGLRVAVAAYAAWLLYAVLMYWSDTALIASTHGRLLHLDLDGLARWQQAAGLAVDLTLWLVAAAACFSAWRLFTCYLQGRIFTVDAASWMRCTAMLGLTAQVLGIAARPLLAAIVTAQLPAEQRAFHIYFFPNDLLTLLLLASLLALSHVQSAGAELAAENAEIV